MKCGDNDNNHNKNEKQYQQGLQNVHLKVHCLTGFTRINDIMLL